MKARVWLGVLLAAVAAGVLVWWLLPAGEEPPRKPRARQGTQYIAEAVPQTGRVARVVRDRPHAAKAERLVKSAVDDRDLRPPEGGYYTNREGKLCYFNADRSAYTNGIEQLLNMVIPSTPGAEVPPLPIISGDDAKELERALKHKLAVAEGDDEKAIERKMLITQGKLELDEQRREGGLTVSEYVNALRDQYNDNAEFLSEARKVDQQIYEDESTTDEDYLAARAQINEKLKERGLPELEPRE